MKSLFLVLLLTLGLLVTACAPGGSSTGPRDVILTATDIAFDTGRIEVTVSQPVALTLRNDGALEHDFSVMHIPVEVSNAAEEQEGDHDMGHMEEMPMLHVSAMPGASNSVTFTPLEAGEYIFFCSVSGHQEAGMQGTLVVSAP